MTRKKITSFLGGDLVESKQFGDTLKQTEPAQKAGSEPKVTPVDASLPESFKTAN